MTTTKKQGGAMCCVTIGYQDFLMPADKGMRVLEAMQHAIGCERNYDAVDGETFYATEAPLVKYALVRAERVRMPQGHVEPADGRRRTPRAIQGNPAARLDFKS